MSTTNETIKKIDEGKVVYLEKEINDLYLLAEFIPALL